MGGEDFSQTKVRNLLSRARRDPYVAIKNRAFTQSSTLGMLFFDQCDDESFFNPRHALERGYIARKIGKDSRDTHAFNHGTALLGSAYRIKGLDDEALLVLKEAEAQAESCLCCLADIYRRRGIVYLWQKDYATADAWLSRSIKAYQQQEDHDGIGRSLISRGAARTWLKRVDDGLADYDRAIGLLADDSPQCFHIGAIINIAATLLFASQVDAAEQGGRYDRAHEIISDLKERLAGKTEFKRVRPTLRWIEGLLCANTGERRRAFDFLRAAKRGFMRLGMNREAIAVSADIACLYKQPGDVFNDEQVIELAEFCLERLEPTKEERSVLIKMTREPTAAMARQFRKVVPCAVPSLI